MFKLQAKVSLFEYVIFFNVNKWEPYIIVLIGTEITSKLIIKIVKIFKILTKFQGS